MRTFVYSKRLFVADLIVASIWALFAAKSTPEIESWELVAVLMRVALCFRMYEKSDWMGYAAIVFAGAYFMLPNISSLGFQKAAAGIIYYVLHVMDWGVANDVSLHPDRTGFGVPYYLFWSLLSIWLVIMPLAVSIRYGKLFRFRKWCWVILVLFFVNVIFRINGYVPKWYFTWAACFVAVCLLPDIYWVVRYGGKKSLVDVLAANRPLMYYAAFVSLFLAAIVLGMRNVYMLKFIGFVTFPAILYVLVAKTAGVRDIPTYDTLIMSLCGAVYWYCPELGQTPRIISLLMAVLICLVVCVRLARKSSSRLAGVILFVGATVILYPALSGMNPYVVTDARHTRPYMKGSLAYNGLYVTDNYDGVCGLRDRYGEILPMKYSTIDMLNDSRDKVLCCMQKVYTNGKDGEYEEIYTFFNLSDREFIQIPGDITITKVERVRKGVYALHGKTGAQLLYLVMS